MRTCSARSRGEPLTSSTSTTGEELSRNIDASPSPLASPAPILGDSSDDAQLQEDQTAAVAAAPSTDITAIAHEQTTGLKDDSVSQASETPPKVELQLFQLGELSQNGNSGMQLARQLKGLLNAQLLDGPNDASSVLSSADDSNSIKLHDLVRAMQSKLVALGNGLGKGNAKILDALKGEDVDGSANVLKQMIFNVLGASRKQGVLSEDSAFSTAESLADDPETSKLSATQSSKSKRNIPPERREPRLHSSDYDFDFAQMTEQVRLETLDDIRTMFSHAYDAYMQHAFPMDELAP